MQPAFSSDGRWRAVKKLPNGDSIGISARDVREEKTGLHAHIGIMFNGVIAAHTVFNVGRDDERTRLANSAHKAMGKMAVEDYTADTLKFDLGMFCLELAELFHDRFEITDTGAVRIPSVDRFASRPYVLNGGGTILFAPPGAGKSWITYMLALSIHFGLNTYWQVNQTPILFVNLERSRASVEHRFAQLMPIMGIAGTLPMIHARGQSLALVAEKCRRAVRERRSGVLFLDSISRGGGGSLVKDDVANETVDVMNSICQTWFAIGHTARDSGDHIFGSQHFDAGADLTVKLSSDQRNNLLGIRLEIKKANDIRRPAPEYIALEFSDTTEDSELVDIRPAREYEFPELDADKTMSGNERLAVYMAKVDEATTSQAAKETGIDIGQVSRMFTKSDVYQFARKAGREVYYRMANV